MAGKQSVTKAQQAYKKIKKLMLTGNMPAGHRTTLRAIAADLGMSVVPVSEAVRRLEQEGFVHAKPQSGIFVTKLTAKKQAELAIVRQAMEVQAARLIAIIKPRKHLDALRKAAQRIVEYQEKQNPRLASYTDWQFHVKLVSSSGCEMLNERYDSIAAIVMIHEGKLDEQWYEMEATHAGLVDALESGDPDIAELAIRAHLNAENRYFGYSS